LEAVSLFVSEIQTLSLWLTFSFCRTETVVSEPFVVGFSLCFFLQVPVSAIYRQTSAVSALVSYFVLFPSTLLLQS
jgi:hypothetical protein